MKTRQLVTEAWWAGVRAVAGRTLVASHLDQFEHPPFTHMLAVGKAAASMAAGAIDILHAPVKGLVISKYDHIDAGQFEGKDIELIESGHPMPDENSLYAGERAVCMVESLDANAKLLVLVSGGASALVEQLKEGMSLADLKAFTDTMLANQATIAEINAARSAQSTIKAGKLLNRCNGASITVLAISDVEGDSIRVIGSGIGACDNPDADIKVIGTNEVARKAAVDYLTTQGLDTIANCESIYGDVFEIARSLSNEIIMGKPGAYVYGGEPVIQLPENPGMGGRNQSLALAIAKQIQKHPGITLIVAGTDGTDGPTEAAGGLVDSKTFTKFPDAQVELDNANAGEYLSKADSLFTSKPTGTNVMDLMVAIKSS